jgi:hypothetical protein
LGGNGSWVDFNDMVIIIAFWLLVLVLACAWLKKTIDEIQWLK